MVIVTISFSQPDLSSKVDTRDRSEKIRETFLRASRDDGNIGGSRDRATAHLKFQY